MRHIWILVLAATLATTGPLLPAMASTTTTDAAEAATPPPGYYYNDIERRWYYYDGTTLTQMDEGFAPPQGEGDKFDLLVKETDTHKGWRLEVYLKRVGVHSLSWRVGSHFTTPTGAICADGSAPPDCIKEGTIPSQNWLLPVGPTVLCVMQMNKDMMAQKPHTGDARAWGWLDDQPHDEANPYVADGPITW